MKNKDAIKKIITQDLDEFQAGVWLQFHVLQIMLSLCEELDDERLKGLIKTKLTEASVEWGEMEQNRGVR